MPHDRDANFIRPSVVEGDGFVMTEADRAVNLNQVAHLPTGVVVTSDIVELEDAWPGIEADVKALESLLR